MTTNELLQSFYEQNKDLYPDIPFEEMKLIVTSPFEMFKQIMASGELEDIRLQYLFVARVSQARIIKHLGSIYRARAAKRMTQKTFDRYHGMLMEYIRSHPEKFKKYEQKIKEIIQ